MFSRLIRFRDEQGTECFGEPVIDSADELLDLCEKRKLVATVLEGDGPFDLTSSSSVQKQVVEILPILSPSDVPLVRCIGLNYIKHSKSEQEVPWPQ